MTTDHGPQRQPASVPEAAAKSFSLTSELARLRAEREEDAELLRRQSAIMEKLRAENEDLRHRNSVLIEQLDENQLQRQIAKVRASSRALIDDNHSLRAENERLTKALENVKLFWDNKCCEYAGPGWCEITVRDEYVDKLKLAADSLRGE